MNYETWQKGRSIPDIISAFDDREEKAIRKGLQIASSSLNDGKEYILKNVSDSPRRSETLASLDKLLSKSNRAQGLVQAALGFAPLINTDGAARDAFYGQVFSGELIGFGYVVPRKPEDMPVRVPDDVWEGKIDWLKSAVNGSGLSFVSVRLVEQSMLLAMKVGEVPKVVKTDAILEPLARNKAGRKSRKEEILMAYETLKAQDILTLDTPKAILGHEVREFLLKDVPKLKRRETGLSDETIRRIIRSTK